MKPFDWVALGLSAVLTLGSAWIVVAPSDAPARVEVQSPDGTFLYPLAEDRTLQVKGPLGLTEVQIRGGAVWVEDSPCTNKVCIAMGHISSSGQYVACLPNRVFVRISGGTGSAEAPDARVY